MIGGAPEFFRSAPDARRIGDIDVQKFRTFSDFLCCGTTSFLVAGAEKDAKPFARELSRNFETNSFIGAGHERDFFVAHSSGEIVVELTGDQRAQCFQVLDIFGEIFSLRRFEHFRDFPKTWFVHDEAKSFETDLPFADMFVPIDPRAARGF